MVVKVLLAVLGGGIGAVKDIQFHCGQLQNWVRHFRMVVSLF
ncbi:hypothetical protein [Sporomusa ovata]|uniref:Uncharacterized protein n=2 Tax=Sporomusa ovata TaxID=2378 RepID=A0A0U1L6I2_9FIRM|nr:hypothetical protein [Sporomusa ovata]CQR74743.1 hypothetical protein SpAn4DRAFT_4100 [Sporomusa ovata]